MLVSLYTVRVILQTLGASDYGIYNAVGGIVAMMSFISSTMSSASLRFYAYELGRKDYIRLNQYFNVTIRTYLIIGLGIIAIAETIGLWFVKTQMVIPSERMSAALWVYQFSILSFFLQILMIPYNALILAREKMNIYAYVSIIEVILKLVVVYVLMISPLDKLKLYAVLICCVNFLHTLFYIVYSRSKFEETKIIRYSNSSMTKEVLGFSSWNMFGTLASVCRSQGVNILLNVFYRKRKFDGQIVLGYIAWYGFGRMFIEGLRTDSLYVGPFRISQVVGLLSFLAATGVMIYILVSGKGKRYDSASYKEVQESASENGTPVTNDEETVSEEPEVSEFKELSENQLKSESKSESESESKSETILFKSETKLKSESGSESGMTTSDNGVDSAEREKADSGSAGKDGK